ncbi:MAG: SGNH/GDSL hydrolase family protein [Wenzhouxiangellaceae bacterium]
MTGRDLLFWSLFAALVPQALWVRKTAVRFPPADGPASGNIGQGDTTIRLLAIGDSIVAGVGARTLRNALVGQSAERLAQATGSRVNWTASGKSGLGSRDVARQMLPRAADAADDAQFDAILVSVGVNDVISLHGIDRWRRDVKALLQALSSRWPGAVIAFSGLPPMNHFPALPRPLRALLGLRAHQFDRVLRELLEDHAEVVHIPLAFEAREDSFCDDGFHPSEQSYAEFGRFAADAIARRIHLGNISASRASRDMHQGA